jgi:leucyl/phenylalanyl-tRNA--protein transferase
LTTNHPPLGPFFLDPNDPDAFPDVSLALADPDGLLAIGGDLSPARLLAAYTRGIFPWYSKGQPILWWSPNPRAVIYPKELHISRRLRRTLCRGQFTVTLDHAFAQVIAECAKSRSDQRGTWITQEMRQAYAQLHHLGYAHSVEVWQDDRLVGGMYGVSLGKVFFGESMFSRETDASKVAMVYLCKQLECWGFALLDCQVQSAHLDSMGAMPLARDKFIESLARHTDQPMQHRTWTFDDDLKQAILRT